MSKLRIPSGPIASRVFLLALSLSLCEAILWVAGYPPWLGSGDMPSFQEPDEGVGWKNREGEYLLKAGDDVLRIRIWDGGRRATRRSKSGPGPQIAIVGDSFAYGYGLSDHETFAWKLQAALPGYSIENYGTPRWGTSQVLLQIRELAKRAAPPARIIYLFNVFHESRNVGEPTWMRISKEQPAGSQLRFPYFEIAPDGRLVERESRGLTVGTWGRSLRLLLLGEEFYRMAEAASRLRQGREVTRRIIEQAASEALAMGSRLTLVYYAIDRASRIEYEEMLRGHPIDRLDCSNALITEERFQLPDGHPGAYLNSLLARCVRLKIADYLPGGESADPETE